MAAKKHGLGKGLDALFVDNNTEDGAITALKLSDIEPNRNQPRTAFDDSALNELADSIRAYGVIQPIVVRPLDKGGYQIVAGERRWRAARRAGLSEVPVVIRDLDEEQTLEIAIIENLQREDLNLVEVAQGYRALMDNFGMTQEQVAEKVGKSRSAVANTVRVLNLSDEVRELVAAGDLTLGHAKALLAFQDKPSQIAMAKAIMNDGLLVRDIERIASGRKGKSSRKKGRAEPDAKSCGAWGNSMWKEIELALEQEYNRKVKITPKGNRYIVEMEFYGDRDMMDFLKPLFKKHGVTIKGEDMEHA